MTANYSDDSCLLDSNYRVLVILKIGTSYRKKFVIAKPMIVLKVRDL